MKKLELLAPAKDLIQGKAAINYGADAVYIGAPKFGARSAVGNSLDDIVELIKYAHQYWAKVYITLNTILFDDELESVQKLLHELYDIGADAIIIQDMGILEMDLPPIPIHASTQTHNYNLEKIKFLEAIGISRIILARELSKQQIENISNNTNVELEAFIHGALCVCFSGQCYISEYTKGRSGNRGECAQSCRMMYSLIDSEGKHIAKDKYLLSLKDLNLSDSIQEMVKAGITSFKIEGRLKDISYVKNVVSHYRRILDDIIRTDQNLLCSSSGSTDITFSPSPEKSFNRGFSSYFFNDRGKDISSINTPKSIGMELGKVSEVGKGFIKIKTNEVLNNGDGLCFFSEEELKGFRVDKVIGDKIYSQNIVDIKNGTTIYRNLDTNFNKQLDQDKSIRRINIDISISEKDSFLIFKAIDEDAIRVEQKFLNENEIAKSPEKMIAALKKQMSKLGETIFSLKEFSINLNEIPFIPVSQLNDLRRKLIENLIKVREKNYPRVFQDFKRNEDLFPSKNLNYKANVVNKLSEKFYREHGVPEIQFGLEKEQAEESIELMKTKYCLKYEFDLCPKYSKNLKKVLEPLYLVDNKNRYRLEFDCKECVMLIKNK